LCLAYVERPDIWTDDYNIPESGNGIPDLLDEVKRETDWLLRMQETNGSVLMKVSVTDFSAASPPSADSGFVDMGRHRHPLPAWPAVCMLLRRSLLT
jgi:hypothetical protein